MVHDADMNMFAFFICRGQNPEYLANASYIEKAFLHCAREEYYKEEIEKYKALFGVK